MTTATSTLVRRWAVCAALICGLTWPAIGQAAPERYRLDGTASRIEFIFDLEGLSLVGRVPVTSADVTVDFADLARSNVVVTMNVAAATANIAFATAAMREPGVLDTARFPQARFVSRRITPVGSGARLEGDLTLRGVTRPVVLDGAIFRRRGSDPGDLSDLVLLFTGSVSRSAFGATGYPHLVADQVDLRILAAIVRE